MVTTCPEPLASMAGRKVLRVQKWARVLAPNVLRRVSLYVRHIKSRVPRQTVKGVLPR
jgi:hypothetical protein